MPYFQTSFSGMRKWPSFLAYLIALRLLGQCFVWTAHDLCHPEATWRWLDRWGTRLALPWISRVIVHTATAHRQIVSEFRVRSRRKIVEIPHGNYIGCYPNTISREQARARLGLDEEAVVFLFLGHIRQYKGVEELIDAFQQLAAPETHLVVAGKPWGEATVARIRQRISDRRVVHLHPGFVPDEDVQVYMNACDVMVFPYHRILTSGAVILAMSFGRACVASKLGCLPDVVDAQGGFLYDPDQPNGLLEALAAAVRNRGRLDAMGAYNLDRAKAWDWGRVAQMTRNTYLAALGGNRVLPTESDSESARMSDRR
jgi:glycosyltransferase involved in cell wall biosynthesis